MVDAGIERRDAFHYCALPATIPAADAARLIREAFQDLDVYLGERQIEERGPSIIRYRHSSEDGPLDVEVGWIIPDLDRIDAPFVIDVLPAGVYVVGWHNGPYARIGETTRELIEWGEERHVAWDVELRPEGDRWASWYELYLAEPSFGPEGPTGSVEVCVGIRDGRPADLRAS